MRGAHGPRVLIHIDERRRDAAVSIALGWLFEAAGCRVTFSARRTTAMLLREVPFDAALLPCIAAYVPFGEVERLSARCKLYLLPTEGAIFGEWPMMVKFGGTFDPAQWERYFRGTTRFFLWGDYSRRLLSATGRFRSEQLVVVGAPRMDFCLAKPPPTAPPRAIGAISGLTLFNSYDGLKVFEAVDRNRGGHGRAFAPSRHIEDWYWVDVAQARLWLELLDACQRRGEPIWVRVHPREEINAYDYLQRRYPGLVRLDGQTGPFEAWLEQVGLLVGFNSTAFFEAVAAGKPTISLASLMGGRLGEHLDGFMGSHYPILDYLERPASWDALFDVIERVRLGRWEGHRGEAQALLKDVCGFPRRISALTAIVRTVTQDLGTAPLGGRLADRLAEWEGAIRARALEVTTFTIRRDRVTSAWFPLQLGQLEQELAAPIRRYLQAAALFPWQDAIPEAAVSR